MTRVDVYDLDDTLYLERDYVRSGFRAVGAWLAQEHGLAGFADQAWELFDAGTRGRIFDEALTAMAADGLLETVPELVRRYRAHPPAISLLPDADAAMERSRACGHRIGLITDGPVASQRAKITQLGLEDRCDVIIVTGELDGDRSKPDPTAFRLMEERTGVSGGALTYLGDNPAKDFIAPAARGWHTVRVRRPEGLHAVVASGPEVGRELADLHDWLPC